MELNIKWVDANHLEINGKYCYYNEAVTFFPEHKEAIEKFLAENENNESMKFQMIRQSTSNAFETEPSIS